MKPMTMAMAMIATTTAPAPVTHPAPMAITAMPVRSERAEAHSVRMGGRPPADAVRRA